MGGNFSWRREKDDNLRIVQWNHCEATDENGKKYIDLTAGGIFAAMFGPDSPIIKEAMIRPKHYCSYAPHYGNYWRDKYVEMLKELTGFESVALFSAGTEATEAFYRCMRIFTGKPGIRGGLCDPEDVGKNQAPPDAMHGMTLGAQIMAGKISSAEFQRFPHLEAATPERTAGMIMEPYHAPSGQFHRIDPTIQRIKKLQETFPDIPLCLDEIQGGFGRTGKLFSYEHYRDGNECFYLHPQFITIGKLCGAGLPLAALLGPKEIMESEIVQEKGHLHSTHSGNPVMCSVGCAVIEEMRNQNLIAESARKGEKLEILDSCGATVHRKGLMAGIGLDSTKESSQVVERCHQRKVMVVDTGRRWVKVGPALTITEEELIRGLKILKEVIEEVVHERETAPCREEG